MDLPREIQTAIHKAVDDERQCPAVASKLLAWFDALSNGNESLTDPESVKRHLDLLFETVEPTNEDAD